jgi:CHAT domain-containing protein
MVYRSLGEMQQALEKYNEALPIRRAVGDLRAAQLELSRQKRWASPYYWAGFVLHGEWK